jgi:hypothetical protein
MLDCMKRQLTKFWIQEHQKFGFGTILCSFSFERVPSLIPRETIRGHEASLPMLCIWVTLLSRQGGGRTIEGFDDNFFDWWSWKIMA